jgi:NAD(P)-dependent dehydrogenase (short-subunit alcohol dehydrogenase family)
MSPVALVSGGTSGIGKAVALRLAADGYEVVAFGSNAERVAELRDAHPDVEARCVDVTDAEAVAALVDDVVTRAGRIDVLCPAAGIKHPGGVADTSVELWDRTFAVNVRGAFLLTRAVLPVMVQRGSGCIVYIGSPSGYGGVDHAAYVASKGALHALATAVALDHVGDGVRVNTVVAGPTRTGMNRERPEAVFARLARGNAAGRVNEPEDIAAVVSFLVSPSGNTISGARIDVGTFAAQGVLDDGKERP